jgi:Na+/proline symporter
LLAAVALKCYRLNTLRSFFESVARTLTALVIAAGLVFTIAFALKVGAAYSRLETDVTFATAAVYLAVAHVLYAAMA